MAECIADKQRNGQMLWLEVALIVTCHKYPKFQCLSLHHSCRVYRRSSQWSLWKDDELDIGMQVPLALHLKMSFSSFTYAVWEFLAIYQSSQVKCHLLSTDIFGRKTDYSAQWANVTSSLVLQYVIILYQDGDTLIGVGLHRIVHNGRGRTLS